MANSKISALTALTGANVDTAADLLAIVDTSASTTKKILIDELRNAIGPISGTEQASTSGTSIDFTSIPSWVKRITIQFVGVSTSGTSPLMVQTGDSGGIETSGYLGSGANFGDAGTPAVLLFTTGFGLMSSSAAAAVYHGAIVLTLEDSTQFTWVCASNLSRSDTAAIQLGSGSKSTSAALDRVRVTTLGGTDTFDAGAINILYD